jgi:hypothetical protein
MRTPCLLPALAVVVASCAVPHPRASAPSPVLGQAVSFTLPTDSGGLVTVPTADHRALVLDFFGPTCPRCRDTVPALLARKADVEARGAQLVLVGVLGDGESTEDARRALASWGVRAPFLKDGGGVSQKELGVDKLPATVVLDGAGVVRWVATAAATADDVVAAVR